MSKSKWRGFLLLISMLWSVQALAWFVPVPAKCPPDQESNATLATQSNNYLDLGNMTDRIFLESICKGVPDEDRWEKQKNPHKPLQSEVIKAYYSKCAESVFVGVVDQLAEDVKGMVDLLPALGEVGAYANGMGDLYDDLYRKAYKKDSPVRRAFLGAITKTFCPPATVSKDKLEACVQSMIKDMVRGDSATTVVKNLAPLVNQALEAAQAMLLRKAQQVAECMTADAQIKFLCDTMGRAGLELTLAILGDPQFIAKDILLIGEGAVDAAKAEAAIAKIGTFSDDTEKLASDLVKGGEVKGMLATAKKEYVALKELKTGIPANTKPWTKINDTGKIEVLVEDGRAYVRTGDTVFEVSDPTLRDDVIAKWKEKPPAAEPAPKKAAATPKKGTIVEGYPDELVAGLDEKQLKAVKDYEKNIAKEPSGLRKEDHDLMEDYLRELAKGCKIK